MGSFSARIDGPRSLAAGAASDPERTCGFAPRDRALLSRTTSGFADGVAQASAEIRIGEGGADAVHELSGARVGAGRGVLVSPRRVEAPQRRVRLPELGRVGD